MSAATPATCGVAIEVPLKRVYVLKGVVLRMLRPGAPIVTVRAPKSEKKASCSKRLVAATEMTFGSW